MSAPPSSYFPRGLAHHRNLRMEQRGQREVVEAKQTDILRTPD
jgi:hypothetical protein